MALYGDGLIPPRPFVGSPPGSDIPNSRPASPVVAWDLGCSCVLWVQTCCLRTRDPTALQLSRQLSYQHSHNRRIASRPAICGRWARRRSACGAPTPTPAPARTAQRRGVRFQQGKAQPVRVVSPAGNVIDHFQPCNVGSEGRQAFTSSRPSKQMIHMAGYRR